MATEIERKFLVAEQPPDLQRYPHRPIRQGYVTDTDDSVEVRIRHSGDQFSLTLKKGSGKIREEVEVSLNRPQFDVLWPLTKGKCLEKVRYEIPHGRLMIEVDVYKGRLSGMIVAEVEFPDVAASESFTPPDWFGTDVTDRREYKNQILANTGKPSD